MPVCSGAIRIQTRTNALLTVCPLKGQHNVNDIARDIANSFRRRMECNLTREEVEMLTEYCSLVLVKAW